MWKCRHWKRVVCRWACLCIEAMLKSVKCDESTLTNIEYNIYREAKWQWQSQSTQSWSVPVAWTLGKMYIPVRRSTTMFKCKQSKALSFGKKNVYNVRYGVSHHRWQLLLLFLFVVSRSSLFFFFVVVAVIFFFFFVTATHLPAHANFAIVRARTHSCVCEYVAQTAKE